MDLIGVTSGTIRLQPHPAGISITNDDQLVQVTVSLEEFAQSTRDFGRHVKSFVLARAPAASRDERVGWWFQIPAES